MGACLWSPRVNDSFTLWLCNCMYNLHRKQVRNCITGEDEFGSFWAHLRRTWTLQRNPWAGTILTPCCRTNRPSERFSDRLKPSPFFSCSMGYFSLELLKWSASDLHSNIIRRIDCSVRPVAPSPIGWVIQTRVEKKKKAVFYFGHGPVLHAIAPTLLHR